jgi:hypothetical protein
MANCELCWTPLTNSILTLLLNFLMLGVGGALFGTSYIIDKNTWIKEGDSHGVCYEPSQSNGWVSNCGDAYRSSNSDYFATIIIDNKIYSAYPADYATHLTYGAGILLAGLAIIQFVLNVISIYKWWRMRQDIVLTPA